MRWWGERLKIKEQLQGKRSWLSLREDVVVCAICSSKNSICTKNRAGLNNSPRAAKNGVIAFVQQSGTCRWKSCVLPCLTGRLERMKTKGCGHATPELHFWFQ